jgi:hypothetical protein
LQKVNLKATATTKAGKVSQQPNSPFPVGMVVSRDTILGGLLLVTHSKQQHLWHCCKLQVARQQQLQEAA